MLIGITGKKYSGKDTIADYLVENYNFTKKSMAQPLKEACKIIFNLTDDQIYTSEKEINDPRWNNVKPREILQVVGTDLFKNEIYKYLPKLDKISDTVWIQHFKQWYKNNKHLNIVLSDIRFKDEINMIKQLGGIVIKVERNLDNNDTHSSENDLNDVKFENVISNNDDLESLYKSIENLNIL